MKKIMTVGAVLSTSFASTIALAQQPPPAQGQVYVQGQVNVQGPQQQQYAPPPQQPQYAPQQQQQYAPPSSSPYINGAPPVQYAPIERQRTSHTSVYAELLGNGLLYSLNVDHMLTDFFSVRAGISYFGVGASNGSVSSSWSIFTAPVMGNLLLGNLDHKLELGLGVVFVGISGNAANADSFASASGFGLAGTATVGYRYQPHNGGMMFRAGFTPIFAGGGFLGWGGMSVGYSL